MFPTHCLQPFPDSPGSHALLSQEASTDTAIIFVHGFGGSAQKTWRDFHRLIDERADDYKWWKDSDVFFFQYDSVTKPIAVTAHHLLSFVEATFPIPDPRLFTLDGNSSVAVQEIKHIKDIHVRPGSVKYKHLVLVGHSEGAVLIRRAIIEKIKLLREEQRLPAQREQSDIDLLLTTAPILSASVVLFAPAYLGASCSGWTGLLFHLSKIGSFLNPILNYMAAYVDLQKGSPVLQSIKEDTEYFANAFGWMDALYAKSVFGDADRIVYLGEYKHDPPPTFVKGQDHLSVCKPKMGYQYPLEIVRYEPRRRASSA
jgi:pimeloyl-ACP methyl ester carboxylesterase